MGIFCTSFFLFPLLTISEPNFYRWFEYTVTFLCDTRSEASFSPWTVILTISKIKNFQFADDDIMPGQSRNLSYTEIIENSSFIESERGENSHLYVCI